MTEDLGSRKRLPEALADTLQEEILELAPGDRLPTEAEIAGRFDVSRTVVRETARLLVQRGLVTVKPGRGMTVAEFDGRLIADQYALLLRLSQGTFEQLQEIRLVLEVEMAVFAAARRTDRHLIAMREANQRLAAADQERGEFLDADLAFHEIVAEASGNPFFALVIRPINGFLREAYRKGPGYSVEACHTVQEHVEIAEAISAGDPSRARFATENHLRRIMRHSDRLLSGEAESARTN
ncbi:DNA-binding transcriptional regulator, FadR family [Saccharopolyspora antimicrobica]|uniref:DNA-binding transcriptional regulator, FadR family n=1 Tax=Saccharopolyspora antimicrobica TaxID=455193 RepID=A0A1I5LWQ8_9PSEU|nr:FadR/GntR family transcriptional regulator [Saccharopolyspora antimicrobica]RKT89041.1 GntR family transcriptional regulator [Saccharopolyspora antimicrobica]SFP01623.1 DNA-binding transcriptional regulator, FadR family [Saccharopolyspora antimicrobica]